MPLDLPYRATILTGLAWFKAMGIRCQVSGAEHIPRKGGAVLAINHISYLDFIMAGYAAHPARRLVRFMAKRETFDHPITGPLMRSYHHISVDRAEGVTSYRNAVDYLRRGEVVGVFPEATISRSFEIKELKSGAVRLAAESEVPLIPLIVWGSQRMMTKDHPKDFGRGKTIALTVGEPMHPTGENAVAETAELRDTMAQLLDETIAAYPPDEQPPGSWWLPARLGGTAPTPEEAKELDAAELRARAAKRAAKRKS